jgi:molecular chaperone HtpG
VEEYITQIAFSGATEFLEKYKDKTTDDQMIGHFGLGFYSAFMVADEVHIDTLSYKEGAQAVHWSCDGGTEYELSDGNHATVGTEITLFLNEESLEFANEYRMREVIERYCSFMPVPIYLAKEDAEQEYETIDESELRDDDVVVEHIHEDAKTEEKENENGEKEIVEVSPATDKVKINKRPVPLNDIHPLWMKHPNECTDEEYKAFYRKVFQDYKEPLFWIHLNMDYPFNLKGILYFPKINMEYETIEATIKLYNNQVFIADNIKEVIPEFLLLLKGVIDCPDLPLNVSRSALQNDGFVKKISDYISKKVADKLTGMCKTDRESYEKYWDDISPFIKFGCIRDDKFADKLNDYVLFKNLDDKYLTLKDCIEANKKPEQEGAAEDVKEENTDAKQETEKDKEEKEPEKTVLYYVTDPVQQSQYINMFRAAGKDAVILTHNIDTAFISHLEAKDQTIEFKRIDADLTEELKGEGSIDEKVVTTLTDVFRKNLGKEKLEVKVENLKDESIAAMVTLSEESRRMQDMMKMYSMYGMYPGMGGNEETLVLNANHPLVKYISENTEAEAVPVICQQLYDLALMNHKTLSPEEMTAFVKRSNEILLMLAK